MIEKSSNVPRIIDRLEIKKLVKRATSEADKRETVISLTQSGIAVLEASTKQLNAIYDEIMPISEADAASINELLEKVREKES